MAGSDVGAVPRYWCRCGSGTREAGVHSLGCDVRYSRLLSSPTTKEGVRRRIEALEEMEATLGEAFGGDPVKQMYDVEVRMDECLRMPPEEDHPCSAMTLNWWELKCVVAGLRRKLEERLERLESPHADD